MNRPTVFIGGSSDSPYENCAEVLDYTTTNSTWEKRRCQSDRTKLLHMCFDRFLLAVESRDLSQADKSVIRVSSFSILQNFNF